MLRLRDFDRSEARIPMHIRSFIHTFTAAGVLGLAGLSSAQGDPTMLQKIADEGKNNSYVMQLLWHITKVHGPRLTGSPELRSAQTWAMDRFKAWGLKNVHLEQWGETPVGFDRGPLQTVRLLGEKPIDLVFTTPCWTNGTNGLTTVEAIPAPQTNAELDKVKNQIKGKWLVYKGRLAPNDPMAKKLDDAGIAGRISGSTNELVITA